MADNRPAIPEAIKREVRQQCCFGCAICGMPFFQYDHVEEYAEVKEHKADNLVLLCPNHHSAKTTHKLSKERIIEAKKNPYNATRSKTSGFKIEPSKSVVTSMGSNRIHGWNPDDVRHYHAIWINGKSFFIIHCESGWLSISLSVTDGKGNVLLHVIEGELTISTAAWDYVYEGDNIKVRAGIGEILLDLNLSNTNVEIIKGMFLDENIDGFLVENGAMRTVYQGRLCGFDAGNVAYADGNGGWGFLNSIVFPDIPYPKGFSCFKKF